jgi:3-isopropylmalate/(R)-2-methylmalate dehydratase large subunit
MASLFEKLWRQHEVIAESAATPALLYIDLHLLHEVTSPQAFAELKSRGLKVRRPERSLATMDHSTPTRRDAHGSLKPTELAQARQVEQLERNCAEFGIELFGLNSEQRGIVHVIGPESGATQPGMTIVCGDSHTSTHGAFGALAFGIGTTEVGHVLATQCLLQRKPKSMRIWIDGALKLGVSAKDLILKIIGEIGVDGGTGHVIEYAGPAIAALSMEQRMTICNMSIEAGARAGLIGCDETTIAYLRGRPRVPNDAAFDAAATRWRTFASDADARFDREVRIDADALEPMISWGTHPGMVGAIADGVPHASSDAGFNKALDYMGFRPGAALNGQPIDVVFIGSCTNGRLSDLRDAARVMNGRQIAPNVRALVVPGSQAVKRQAEAEGLDQIFLRAGAEWHESGCSMCLGMNGDTLKPGQLSVSTSNRNFEGRQGRGARTLLASPLTAAASAVRGVVTDPRTLATEAVA